jgi:hypothetical protein
MIRFINLGKQIWAVDEEDERSDPEFFSDFPRHFAFWDTITKRFLEFDDEQIWTNWQAFEAALQEAFGTEWEKAKSGNGKTWIERCKGLCSEWVFEKENKSGR